MTAMLTCLKKEYWEERSILLGLPIGLATILIVSLIIALFLGVRYANQFEIDFNIGLWNNNHTSSTSFYSSEELQVNDESNHIFQSDFDSQNHINQNVDYLHDYGNNASSAITGLIFIFMSVSWFAGLSYLLSSLYKDRKDKTVFFWKSLPVSEKMNVCVKIFFGAFCYTGVALVVAWITCVVVFILLFFVQNLVGAPDILTAILSELTFMNFIVLPLISFFMAALWGFPVFGYVLFVSAFIKRAPFFMAVWPPLAIVIVEKIIFDSEYAIRYFISLFPLQLFSGEHIHQGIISFVGSALRDDLMSILLSGFLTIACACTAVWLRNNRFEI